MLKQSLNGNWQFRRTDSDWLPAYVPGSVYADLLREKKIEDPVLPRKRICLHLMRCVTVMNINELSPSMRAARL